MFNINSLTLINGEKEYVYSFSEGINYFRGKNDTGKTEFYTFIDFMFGSSEKLTNREWYKGFLTKAKMRFSYNDISYEVSRSLDGCINTFQYSDEDNNDTIDAEEYKQRLNAVFSVSNSYDKLLYAITGEHLKYRSFTIFNFLDEVNQGLTYDFFTKCRDIKYSVRLNPILNYIFNDNIEKIIELNDELNRKNLELKRIENDNYNSDFIINRINHNLRILSIQEQFTGKNIERINELLDTIKKDEQICSKPSMPISELLPILNSIDEQIKMYTSVKAETNQIKNESERRKTLLEKLQGLIEIDDNYSYLVKPIISLINQLDKSISFQRAIIEDKTIDELKKKREQIKKEILIRDNKYRKYSIAEKEKAFILIESDIKSFKAFRNEEAIELKKQINALKNLIKELQSKDDIKRIDEITEYINELYSSCQSVSSFVRDDYSANQFRIKYIKKGNILSPTIVDVQGDNQYMVNYDMGSLARHTLMQLCGYLAFLKNIIKDPRIPVIPFLVIDHISKPFDKDNLKSIGVVLRKFINDVGVDNCQVIIFEDKKPDEISINECKYTELKTNNKTGFNPFYNRKNEKQSQ